VSTPILMISALSDVDERVRGLRAGGDDYLTKPFASDEMAARVEVLLRRKSTVTEPRPPCGGRPGTEPDQPRSQPRRAAADACCPPNTSCWNS
jgi:DNA-binding response OmpR family regulator